MEGLPEKKENKMRRTIALLTTMAMTLLMATSVAMAVTKTCDYTPLALDQETCWGTDSNDTIYGTVGNDTVYAAAGNDRIVGNAGNDAMHGLEGTDTADFSGSPAKITASLATYSASGEGSDTLSGMENLVGSKYNDTLTGSSGANTLTGG
jgi:Ca2+-binding RTX toxin-like protein